MHIDEFKGAYSNLVFKRLKIAIACARIQKNAYFTGAYARAIKASPQYAIINHSQAVARLVRRLFKFPIFPQHMRAYERSRSGRLMLLLLRPVWLAKMQVRSTDQWLFIVLLVLDLFF